MPAMGDRQSVEASVVRMRIAPRGFCPLADENFGVMMRVVNVQTKLFSVKYAQRIANVLAVIVSMVFAVTEAVTAFASPVYKTKRAFKMAIVRQSLRGQILELNVRSSLFILWNRRLL